MSKIIIPIRRPNKLEAVKAMNALVERGFSILTPLQEVKTITEQRGRFNYRKGKYESKATNNISFWYCRLEGAKRNG